MEIKNGAVYKDNFARAAAYFLGTLAPEPAAGARLAAYSLIKGMYEAAAADASALGYKPLADVSFAPWEQQKGRDKDILAIRAPIAKIETMVSELFYAVESAQEAPEGAYLTADAPLGRATKRALALAGAACGKAPDGRVSLALPAGCLTSLKELAAISRAHTTPVHENGKEDKPYLLFSRGVFNPAENWTARAFDRLLDASGELLDLCAALEERGYKRADCFEGQKIGLDYTRLAGKKDEPLKWAWAERVHAGISLTYEELRLAPAFLWVRMPMYPDVLHSADKLPERARRFLFDHTKNCDGCRYCVQTDKTGQRPLAAIPLDGRRKCPRFPGFTMNWRALDSALKEDILFVLDALEQAGF